MESTKMARPCECKVAVINKPNVETLSVAMRRKYANPPIQEALCELSLSGVAWNKRAVESFFSQVRPRYDGLPYTSVPRQALIEATAENDLPVPGVLLVLTADGTRLLRASAHQLTILTTAPYLGWEEYEERIREALEAFASVFDAAKVTKIRVVYDNNFLLPDDEPESNYLGIIPAEVVPESPRFYFSNTRITGDKVELETNVSRYSEGAPQKVISLGIEVTSERLDVTPKDSVNVLRQLKSAITEQFEASITDRARALFGVDE